MVDFSDAPPPAPPAPTPEPAGVPAACVVHGGRDAVTGCLECNAPVCEECASRVTEGENAGQPVCPACAAGAPVEPSVPWESREGRSLDTFKRTFFMPFTQAAPLFTAFPSRPLGSALGFAMLAAIPGAILQALSQVAQNAIGIGPIGQFKSQQLPQLPPEAQERATEFLAQYGAMIEAGLAGVPIVALIFVPLAVVFSALVFHLGVWMMGGRNDLVTTMRMVCYLQPLSLVAAVPIIGPMGASVWTMIVMIVAAQRVHGLTSGRAAVVGFMPVILALLFACCGCIGFIGIVAAAAAN